MTETESSTVQESMVLEYKGIGFTPRRIVERNGKKVSVSVAWDEVQRLRLMYRFQSRHPFLQIGIGIALTAVGTIPLLCMIGWLPYNYFCSMLLFLLLGGWAMWDGMRRRFYLDVALPNGHKRLVFQNVSDPSELLSFLAHVQEQFGWKIHA
jgi:hypothetical protein